MLVTCLYKKTKRREGYLLIYDLAAWPYRCVKHRGWHTPRTLYIRPALPDEVAFVSKATRHPFWVYKSLAALVKDEIKHGVDVLTLLPPDLVTALQADPDFAPECKDQSSGGTIHQS